MAHDPSQLAYADYFAAAAAGLVQEVGAGEEVVEHLYGVHQPGAEVFGVRGRVPGPMLAEAHGKAAARDVDVASAAAQHFVLGGYAQQLHRRQQGHQAPLSLSLADGPAEAASLVLHLHQHSQLGLGGGAPPLHDRQAWPQQAGACHLRGSRFLLPAQQLLQEFCSLPVAASASPTASKPPTTKTAPNESGSGSSSSARIQNLDAAELQRLKTKLYAMLEEVDRRYRRYREQMRSVSGSFEAVAGERAAAAYTRLVSRTISRHFRSLRDGVAAQLQAARLALGEEDAAGGGAPGKLGTTTPRLRVLDQCLRQHRAYQAGALECPPWRPQRGLPERAVSVLRAWLFEHFLHPYPSDVDKHILSRQTGLSRSQVSNWFINARVRLWKPMVEEMYAEEMKDGAPEEGGAGGGGAVKKSANNLSTSCSYGDGPEGHGGEERKPTRTQLVHDAGSLASVVSIGSAGQLQQQQQQSLNFGTMDHHLDFDAYDDDHDAAAGGHRGFGAGVSLTLGLHQQQQHADDPHGGVNVAFSGAAAPAAAHEFLFVAGGEQQMVTAGGSAHYYPDGHGQFGAGMEERDAVAAASHYHHRGLSATTGFQLLHDLAG